MKRELNNSEETSCDWCGCPLLPGDTIYEEEDTGPCFCSKNCQEEFEKWTELIKEV